MVDRVKDLIITGGFNVYPGEVEGVLRSHPDVADAAVVGLPGPDGSETVAAAVVPLPGRTLAPDNLRAYSREHLAGYKVPRRFSVVADLPRSVIGKALHRQVRADLQAGLQADQHVDLLADTADGASAAAD
jgi:long-chain acyl-CoA synthetase